MGYKPFVDHFDAWLYVKLAHPWHGDIIVIANANPHALRILLLFAFLMVALQMKFKHPYSKDIRQGFNKSIPL